MMGKNFKSSSQIWSGIGDTIFEEMLGDRSVWLAGGRDLLISEEMIGRQGSRPALLAAHLREMKKIATNWAFERLKIICMIRRQDLWLASHYAQMSGQNPGAGQADFERFIREVTSARESRYQFGMLLDFNVLYDHLAEISGAENLLMLPYEVLNKSPCSFLQSLLEGLDTPDDIIKEICDETSGTAANVCSDQGVWYLRRSRHRVLGMPLPRWIFNNHKQSIEVTTDIKYKIFEVYSTGNQKLAQKTDLDREDHEYFNFGVDNHSLKEQPI